MQTVNNRIRGGKLVSVVSTPDCIRFNIALILFDHLQCYTDGPARRQI